MSVVCTVRLHKDIDKKLTEIAKANKRSKAFYIKEALDEYLLDLELVQIVKDRENDELVEVNIKDL